MAALVASFTARAHVVRRNEVIRVDLGHPSSNCTTTAVSFAMDSTRSGRPLALSRERAGFWIGIGDHASRPVDDDLVDHTPKARQCADSPGPPPGAFPASPPCGTNPATRGLPKAYWTHWTPPQGGH